MRLIKLILAVVLTTGLLAAATLERLSLDEMILQSTAIVRGRVVSQAPLSRGSLIYTQFEIAVIELYKGTPAKRVSVVVPGGTAGGRMQTFAGAPKLSPGDEYVMFLWTGRNGLTHIIGLSQGLLTVSADSAGQKTAGRPAVRATMVDSKGRVVEDKAVDLKLAELSQRIQSVVAAKARQ